MYLPGVGPRRKEILSKELDIQSWRDLIEYYPYKYVDRSRIYTIREMTGDMPFVQLKGKIVRFEEFDQGARKKRIVAHFTDGTGFVDLVWFNGSKYIYDNYKVGIEYIVFGRPGVYGGRYQFAHPDIERATDVQLSDMGMQPYYITTERMKKSGLMSHNVEKLTKTLVERIPAGSIPETLPPFIIEPLHLIGREEALRKIHYPKDVRDVQQAQYRLKFEELFYVQLNILRYASDHRRKFRGYVMNRVGRLFKGFYFNHLKFQLTNAQKRVMHEIQADMMSGKQMNRLLQGDVGSGKTLVALMVMLLAIDNGFQACLMAPTEILAEQHLQTLRDFLGNLPVTVELLTGMVKGKRRQNVLDRLKTGEVFGVAERARLWSKGDNPPHVLVMTATPIPRTLAMTVYGDLDVSVIDELPPGRKPVVTLHKYDTQMGSVYQGIRQQVSEGRQVYIVFPVIKESEKSDLKNLEEGFATLSQVFPDLQLSKVHGKMKPADKEAEMQRFVNGETQILVSTTVIEVGVNVPNATVMIILDAQRFGLSQLHQLRGRVGRGGSQSYCVLVTGTKLAEDTRKRISIMCETNDGFRIAEADLKLRGPGDLEGTQQSGIAFDLKIADIARDGQLVQLARDEAQKIIDADPQCVKSEYQLLWNRLKELRKSQINWSAIS